MYRSILLVILNIWFFSLIQPCKAQEMLVKDSPDSLHMIFQFEEPGRLLLLKDGAVQADTITTFYQLDVPKEGRVFYYAKGYSLIILHDLPNNRWTERNITHDTIPYSLLKL